MSLLTKREGNNKNGVSPLNYYLTFLIFRGGRGGTSARPNGNNKAIGAVTGAVAGATVGTFVAGPVGTVVGGVVGAGVGAIVGLFTSK